MRDSIFFLNFDNFQLIKKCLKKDIKECLSISVVAMVVCQYIDFIFTLKNLH